MARFEFVEPDGHVITLHLNSWIARLPGGVNNAMTFSAHHILVSRDWLTAKGLAHECGHVKQARARGWRYLPWVFWCYLTQGYAKSDPERDADAYMDAHHTEYPAIGVVPTWVRDK